MDVMSDLLNTQPVSESMMNAIAIQLRASELAKEFTAWSQQRRLKDETRLASILKAWKG